MDNTTCKGLLVIIAFFILTGSVSAAFVCPVPCNGWNCWNCCDPPDCTTSDPACNYDECICNWPPSCGGGCICHCGCVVDPDPEGNIFPDCGGTGIRANMQCCWIGSCDSGDVLCPNSRSSDNEVAWDTNEYVCCNRNSIFLGGHKPDADWICTPAVFFDNTEVMDGISGAIYSHTNSLGETDRALTCWSFAAGARVCGTDACFNVNTQVCLFGGDVRSLEGGPCVKTATDCAVGLDCCGGICKTPADADLDGDGHRSDQCDGGDDCDDNPAQCGADCHAAHAEICDDGYDNDCDTFTDCDDTDCAGSIGPNGWKCCPNSIADCGFVLDDCKDERCTANECIVTPRPPGDTTECGTCEACDALGGDCVARTGDDGKNCVDLCTYCNAATPGVCVPRPQCDTGECVGMNRYCADGVCVNIDDPSPEGKTACEVCAAAGYKHSFGGFFSFEPILPNPSCCGDDPDENYVGGTDATYACCDNKNAAGIGLGGDECVLGGLCQNRVKKPEVCDGIDNDCDGFLHPNEIDDDGDGVSECAGDCNDLDIDIFLGHAEECDTKDNDCNGLTDANDPNLVAGPLCTGHPLGVCNNRHKYCDAGVWKDCDAPGFGPEICNDFLDNDCDGLVDLADGSCKACAIGFPCEACAGWVTPDTLHTPCAAPYTGCVRDSGAGYYDWSCCVGVICKIQIDAHL